MSQVQNYIKKRAEKGEEFVHLMEIEEAKLDIALKLAELRKSTGLTQKQLAQKIGKPQSTISRVETGEMNPSIELVIELAQGLDKKLVINFE
ncbi:helix-turn-helix domain-containing protein [Enterococcus mundtii]|uniref:helix-turn-helix domain-containing protein n=1 Tax=Enterococcus TaxID=1350 RepID=UPI0008EAFA36|nr:helix-turn-helix transcriptional regulator [Enterococcus mundtii]SFM09684.1 DNA-binding transcriptional regulator, XRE-family HTH domain [Enterococcus mundtii]